MRRLLSSTPILFAFLIAAWEVSAADPDEGEPAEPAEGAEATEAPTAPEPPPGPCDGQGRWEGELSDSTSALATTHATEIAALEAWAFPETTPEQEDERVGVRTDGLLIYQGGELLYERYARGYDAQRPHLIWSASKSFTNALIGVAVRDGLLSLDDSICQHLELPDQRHCGVTVQHLLEFSSGLDWRETYENEPPTTSSVVDMLYGAGESDLVSTIAAYPRRAEPGTVWQYSSGDTNLLAAVARAVLEPRYGADYERVVLLDPLGMDRATWERDGKGVLVGSSYLYAPPRQLARFGGLLAQEGCWQGERLLPQDWVRDSTRVSLPIRRAVVDWEPGDVQGRQFWLNQPLPEHGQKGLTWPSAPPDTFAAMGHWKQAIAVIPSLDVVIVRTGDDRDGSYSWDRLFELSLALVDCPDSSEGGGLGTSSPVPAGEQIDSVPRKFETGLLGLGAGYGARLMCSCLFVTERDLDSCGTWVRASPDIVRFRVDHDAKSVTGKALGLKRRTASFTEGEGCRLVD